jgi:hypothetical protein
MRMPRRTLAIAFFAAMATDLVGCTSGPVTPSHRSEAATRPPLPFTASRAVELRNDLESGDAAHVEDAVAVPANKALPLQALAALKALGPVTFNPDTFSDRRDGTATVTANTGAKTWTVFLVQAGDRWLLSATSQN